MAAQPAILFLPGVMGSRLFFPNSGKFWDPDSTWRMLRWAPVWPFRSDDDNRRELHAQEPAGVLVDPGTREIDAEGVRLGWSGVVWSYYGAMLHDLRVRAGKGRTFAVGYDWRQDIQWLGEYVAGKFHQVLEATGADQIAVVTHSMGGLVARAALRYDPNLIDRVSKLIHICQPATGAVILYRRLFTGLVRGYDGGGGVGDRAFRLLLGNSRAAFVGNMSGQPGPLQLMPSEYFPKNNNQKYWNEYLNNGMLFSALYGNPNSPPGLRASTLGLPPDVLADLDERVLDIADFHEWLGPAETAGSLSLKTWVIHGTGVKTEVQISFPGGSAVPTQTNDGDGTVPSLSALALAIQPSQVHAFNNLDHSSGCKDSRVRSLVQNLLS